MSDDKSNEVKFVTELDKFCSEDVVEISGQSSNTEFVGVTSNFAGLLQKVAELGYTFSIYNSNKKVKGAVRFACNIGDLRITSSYPFKSGGSYYYHCAHGPNRQKKEREREYHAIGKHTRVRYSKKMDCKAILNVRKIALFPDYKLPEGRISWRMKGKILKDMKADDARMEIWHVFKISLPSVHHHRIETSLLSQAVHSSVIEEISRLVSRGFTNVRQIRSMLDDFVKRTVTSSSDISTFSRAFHPDEKTVRNYVSKFKFLKERFKVHVSVLHISHDSSNERVANLEVLEQLEDDNNIVIVDDSKQKQPFTEGVEIRKICKKIIDLTYDAEGMYGDCTEGAKAVENLLDVYNGLSKAYAVNTADNGSLLCPTPCEKKRKSEKYAELPERKKKKLKIEIQEI